MSIKKESYVLNISTQDLNVEDTSDFTIDYSKLYLNPQKEYHLALTSYQLWNSIYNITTKNNGFAYYNGATTDGYYIPPGTYSIEDINIAIKKVISDNGDNPDNITITANYTTFKVDILVKNGYALYLITNGGELYGPEDLINPGGGYGLGYILGWYKNTGLGGANDLIDTSNSSVGVLYSSPLKVDITNGVDSLLINCSLVDSKYNLNNDEHGQSLYNVIIDAPRGGILQKNISNPIYQHSSQQGSIHSVRFYITDQSLNKIDLHGEHVNLTIHIEEV